MAAHAHDPSSSSSSCTSRTDCDVFLSFRGKDTYNNFTSHLRYSLDNTGIVSFVANNDLEVGDTIWPALEKAITRSRIFIPIFSKNYSSSKWCLNELVKSMETKDQIVLPIFFDVDPRDVRKQEGDFGQQFQQLAENSDEVTVERWKKALEKAGYYKGHDLLNECNGNQSELIQRVVKYVNHKLEETSSGVPENLVGINSIVEQLLELLNLASKGVKMVGIWGMEGIGKTTAAHAVFDQIRHQFEGCIFLEDIREASKQFTGLVGLQRDLLRGILNQKFKFLGSATQIKSLIRNRLKAKKVLIVLDDVDEVEQLDALAGNVNWFGKRSRIIITTRDKSVQSLQLFCMHAFKNNPNAPDFLDLAEQVAHTVGGLPLVLKVLGSFLSFKTNREEWKFALHSLINISRVEARNSLKKSRSWGVLELTQLLIWATTATTSFPTQAKRRRLQLPQVTWKYAQQKAKEVGNKFSICGYITEISFKRDPWYTSCSNCFKKVLTDADNNLYCPKCKSLNPATKLRYILRAKIYDWTDTVNVTIFGDTVNQAFRISAQDLATLSQDVLLLQKDIESRLKNPFIFEIKRSQTRIHPNITTQFIANYIEHTEFR